MQRSPVRRSQRLQPDISTPALQTTAKSTKPIAKTVAAPSTISVIQSKATPKSGTPPEVVQLSAPITTTYAATVAATTNTATATIGAASTVTVASTVTAATTTTAATTIVTAVTTVATTVTSVMSVQAINANNTVSPVHQVSEMYTINSSALARAEPGKIVCANNTPISSALASVTPTDNASAGVDIGNVSASVDIANASLSVDANVNTANATSVNFAMPTAISSGASTSEIYNINLLMFMQQQISRLEIQLKDAQVKIAESERQRFNIALPQSTLPTAAPLQSTFTNNSVQKNCSVTFTGSLGVPPTNALPCSVTSAPVHNGAMRHSVSLNQLPTTIATSSYSRATDPTLVQSQFTANPPITSQVRQQASWGAAANYGQSTWSPAEQHNEGLASAAALPHGPSVTLSSPAVSIHPLQAPRKMLDLPLFSGQPEEWPIFYASYIESTSVYNYTNFENNLRLNKCLKGEAREAVISLLIHPNNVGAIIEQLCCRFGRPEQLVRSQLKAVRDVPCISEANIYKLISFATITKNLTVFLQSIGEDKHLMNPTLLEELITKLPFSKRLDWAKYSASIRPHPTIVHFSNWLTEVASFVQMVQDHEGRDPKRRAVLHATGDQRVVKCIVCQKEHKVLECRRLLEATVSDRWKTVKRLRLCFSCLQPGHATRNCRRRKVCPVEGCSRYHNRLLHDGEVSPLAPSTTASVTPSTNTSVLNCSAHFRGNLLFRIVPVTLYGTNKRIDTYALLDEGSSITMMDNSLIQELGLRAQQSQVEIQWFGGKSVSEMVGIVNLYVSGLGMKKRHLLRNVHGVADLNLPTQSLSTRDICNATSFKGKMPLQPYENVTPRLLIGLDHCHLGLPNKPLVINKSGPYVAFTDLGCVVFGPSYNIPPRKFSCLHLSTSEHQMRDMIEDYFSTESFGVRAAPPFESAVDLRAKRILETTTVKIRDRFRTGLLWKNDVVELPESYNMALKRLINIEKRMARDPEFAEAYRSNINSYVDKNYARKLQPYELVKSNPKIWYLPHFAVVNPHKPEKFRLVFDAAAMSHGISLNSQLLKGPQEYRPLVSILFHFRQNSIAVCGDIQEMFHQVAIQPEDRSAQRFLWRDCATQEPPDMYEMTVMTFGAACSPCSAHYVKVRNALEHVDHDPRAIRAITDYHYVDDYVDSFSSASEAIRISQQVKDIHNNAGFQLRKFRSNAPEVVTALAGETSTLSFKSKESMESGKVLGMLWQPSNDYFTYRLEFHSVDASIMRGERVPTKRILLSIIMSIFDPLGFLCHFTITAKLIMREIWKRNLCWDEPVTGDINAMWSYFRKQLINVGECQIPRHYFRKGEPQSLQLHVFVDASEDAFGAVAYWRSENVFGDVEVSLVLAKTKSAPLKLLTIPRLELQAALLGSRMVTTIAGEHSIRFDRFILWSDSRTVLKWLSSEHCRYKPFVAHRVAEILNVSKPSDWRWVPTKQNIADEVTRVNRNVDLSPSSPWFTGPDFLYSNEQFWPTDNTASDFVDDREELRPKYALLMTKQCLINFHRFSSFNKVCRVAAWVIRFVSNCKSKRRGCTVAKDYGLTAVEIAPAERLLCRYVQREEFGIDMNRLDMGLAVRKDSPLYTLTPYIDDEGTLRACGRLDAIGWLPYETRRPIILPPLHAFTKLLVMHEHSRMMHQNIEATISVIRRKYWIPNLRKALRGIISRCNVCRIRKVRPTTPKMGLLPGDRATPYVRPFTYTGLDYFGPVNVTIGRRTEKRWVALFTCLTTRAIHLELAHDLSTDACIIAMRNFMNRRGVPKRIRSDNGKNFIGVAGELRRMSDVFDCCALQTELSNKGVEWIFNCPENPSEGGVWERMVQCVKKVLNHTMKEISPKEHTFNSLLIEAENIVNSRPLTHLPVAPDQEEPLTPNHFLLGSTNTAQTPSCSDPSVKLCSLRKQWRIARQMRDRFWKRWVEEYLPTLTRRVKWCLPTKPLEEGDLVFICDMKQPRKEWRRGRIERVFPGKDGQVRRADVLTSTGIVRRPASKLAKLDVVDCESDSIHGGGDVDD